MYTDIRSFEWDERKARRNAMKHGVGFKEAISVFHDPNGLEVEDIDHSEQEQRYWLIGESGKKRTMVVVFTK